MVATTLMSATPLVLIHGQRNSGKTTTAAALTRQFPRVQRWHVWCHPSSVLSWDEKLQGRGSIHTTEDFQDLQLGGEGYIFDDFQNSFLNQPLVQQALQQERSVRIVCTQSIQDVMENSAPNYVIALRTNKRNLHTLAEVMDEPLDEVFERVQEVTSGTYDALIANVQNRTYTMFHAN